jgi:SHS2 domain-containing protein
MPYVYVDDIAVADTAFRAWGDTLEAAFRAAAEATIQTMVETHDAIAPRHERRFERHDTSRDLLLLQCLSVC